VTTTTFPLNRSFALLATRRDYPSPGGGNRGRTDDRPPMESDRVIRRPSE
jgi:hypothetical protein